MGMIMAITSHDEQSAATPQPRLVQAAHEFEAQMMKELLRPMAASGEDDGSEPASGGALADFASEALGQSLSSHGGFGIATSVLRSLSRNEGNTQTDPASGKGPQIVGVGLK